MPNLPWNLTNCMVIMRRFRATAIPLIVFGIAALVVYVSATTNMSALHRWRMQAFPFLFSILAAGLMMSGSRGNPLALAMCWVTRPATRVAMRIKRRVS